MQIKKNQILTNIKKFLKHKIFLIPPICLTFSFLSSINRFTYNESIYLGNLFGYSIAVNLVLFYHFWFSGKYCWFTKLAVLGMPLMNIIRICKPYLGSEAYVFTFQTVIFTLVLGLSIYLKINKN